MTLFRDGTCPPLRRWPEWAQVLGFTACALFINFVIGLLAEPLGLNNTLDAKHIFIQTHGSLYTFLMVVVAGPYTETIYGQWFALFIARVARRTPFFQIVWAAVWFSLLHLQEGLLCALQNFGIGWVLASCFVFGRPEGWLKSYRLTSFSHSLHNLIVFFIP